MHVGSAPQNISLLCHVDPFSDEMVQTSLFMISFTVFYIGLDLGQKSFAADVSPMILIVNFLSLWALS